MKTIEDLRGEIDRIDSAMISLFTERMQIVSQISDLKKTRQLPVYDPGREERLIQTQSALVPQELRKSYLDFYSAVFRISREYQRERTKNAGEY